MKVKFPTLEGPGEAKGDQVAARECYVNSLRGVRPRRQGPEPRPPNAHDQNFSTTSLVEAEGDLTQPQDPKRRKFGDCRLESAEELKIVELFPGNSDKVTKIGSLITSSQEDQLLKFLRKNTDVFAWQMEDLTGISPEVMVHQLNIDPRVAPVQQKRRSFGPEQNQIIVAEVDKLLKANYIRPVFYPPWLANVVLVPKPNGKWRLCIDFTDLNKACPKDPFPLPRIDALVDSTAECELLSFLDAYQGYNQIRLAPEDQEMTSFVTARGIYCYNVMPFGLKNAGATYQRLVNFIFRDQIGRNMEVYIDDMLVKSRKREEHFQDLAECFAILRKYNLKLNPAKCVFGVTGGKFLGFMVSERGIEANPEKIKAILDMPPPRTIKEVHSLAGRLTALNRFVSMSAEKGLPFFKMLRGIKKFNWTPECDEAFRKLKEYLSSPPLLRKPVPGEVLYLYLAATDTAVSAVLVREEERQHQPIYYVSRLLQGAEKNYPPIEKVALALIAAAKKLRPYFQAHPIKVLTNHPLRKVLQTPETSGRLVKWAVELSEFDIEYCPRPAIKAQVLADFAAEGITPSEPVVAQWTIYTDGSATNAGSGAGVVQ